MEFLVICENWDNGTPSDVIYLDFHKALNKVPHERLLITYEATLSGYWSQSNYMAYR